jgi:hypothetical protein
MGAFEQLRRLAKVSCWNAAEYESETMWQLYAAQRKGVAVVTSAARLRDALQPFRLSPQYGEEEPWWGSIKYVDLSVGSLRSNMLERFFYKHRAFETEREFRVVISLRLAEEFGVQVPEFGIDVPVNVGALVERIVLGP